jgi:hypothetical protein
MYFQRLGGEIATLQTDVTTLQTDVGTLQTDVGFTPVLMYAHHTSTETPAVNGTLVNWTVQINDGGGSFSSGVYTVPVTGRYRVQCSLLLDNALGGTVSLSGIYVAINSTNYARIFFAFAPTTAYGMGGGEAVLDLTSGDTVSLVSQVSAIWFGFTGANTVGGWTIERIRSA